MYAMTAHCLFRSQLILILMQTCYLLSLRTCYLLDALVSLSSFEDLLVKDGSVTIHEKDLSSLVTEMFKIKNKLSPPFICDLVKESSNKYQTRSHYSIKENESQ